MRFLWFLAAILLLTYGVYYSVRYITLPKPPKQVGPEQMPLSKVKQVADSEVLKEAWSNMSGSTLLFYIFPKIMNRTAAVGNEYATAVQIGSKESLKLLISPDAGRGSMLAPAVLEVFVSGQQHSEIIDITNINLQSWSFVAIVKQGRKFNIYVNGNLTASHTCTAMPDYDDTQPLKIGDSRLGGTIALMSLASYAMQLDEIQAIARETMDTDNKPYLSSEVPILPEFSLSAGTGLFTCPGGNCNTNIRPSPFNQWKSIYA